MEAELEEMMAGKGVEIRPWHEPGFSEGPFYPFASEEGLMRSIFEAAQKMCKRCYNRPKSKGNLW